MRGLPVQENSHFLQAALAEFSVIAGNSAENPVWSAFDTQNGNVYAMTPFCVHGM